MQPGLLYYVNLLLCGIVFFELLISFRKNPVLKLYLLLIIASLFSMNYFALAGVDTRIQFIIAKFARLVYVCSTLLVLIHLVHQKTPRWFNGLIIFSAVVITGIRLVYYNQINIKALPDIHNPVFSIGTEFYSPKPGPRYLVITLAIVAIVIAYYYYRRLLMKLDIESVHYMHLLRWIISLVVPFFLLIIFGILGNLQLFSETLSSYLFAFFSCTAICSFILRPKFLDTGIFGKNQETGSEAPGSAAVV